jgi:hypothetical protein
LFGQIGRGPVSSPLEDDSMAKTASLSIPKIMKFMESCQTDLADLMRQRDRLAADLAAFDAKLGSMGAATSRGPKAGSDGPVRKVRRRKPKRPKNAQKLPEVLKDVLSRNKKGLLLGELAQKVLDSGFKSNSEKFNNVVYQTLYSKKDLFERDGESGMWKLKG